MENQQSGYESYVKEAGMVPAFHSKAVSHGKNVQATNSRAGTVSSVTWNAFSVIWSACSINTIHVPVKRRIGM